MSHFFNTTVQDMRGGRDSWRVILTLSVPAFTAAFLIARILHF